MACSCDPSGYRRIFGERTARRNAKAYRRGELDGSARWLVDRLRERGVGGASVLEVGGGVGAIQLELLCSGAEHATNVELHGEYEREAIQLARDKGLEGRIDRRVSDFVEAAPDIPAADVVVLHRVVCCYPYLRELLAPAADRAKRVLALTYPRSTVLTRNAVPIGDLLFRLTRCSFRFFVHPPAEIARIAESRGLRRVAHTKGLLWESAIFERSAGAV